MKLEIPPRSQFLFDAIPSENFFLDSLWSNKFLRLNLLLHKLSKNANLKDSTVLQ